jgi:hypothetical protein
VINKSDLVRLAVMSDRIGEAPQMLRSMLLVFTTATLTLLSAGAAIGGPPAATPLDTIGIYLAANGEFLLRNANSTGAADAGRFRYGPADAVPLAGNWDGDADETSTIGVYVPTTRQFLLRNSNAPGGADIKFAYGPDLSSLGGLPVMGDWDGDVNHTVTVGVYRADTREFLLRNTNDAGGTDLRFAFGPSEGTPGDIFPLAGDWDGDGVETIGIYDSSTGEFFLRNSNDPGNSDQGRFRWGPLGTPLVGDWDEDGADEIGIFDGNRFLLDFDIPAVGGADVIVPFGPSMGEAVTGDWNGASTN